MPTIDDFLQRFSGGGSVDDRDAQHYYDRFASTHENDREFDNDTMYHGATEYLGQLPDDRFHEAAFNGYQQAPPQQRQSLLGSLFGALRGQGMNPSAIGNQLGLSSTDPQSMNPHDFARFTNYVRQQHPEVMRETVRQEPGFMKMLGNPIVGGALAVVAAKMLQRHVHA